MMNIQAGSPGSRRSCLGFLRREHPPPISQHLQYTRPYGWLVMIELAGSGSERIALVRTLSGPFGAATVYAGMS